MCTVCKHNQTKDIDRALLTGATLSSLSRKYGFSTAALHRHQEHLRQKMAQAQKRFQDGLHQGLFCKLNIVLELVLGVVRGAKAGEDFKLFLQATRELTRIISLMHKMEVPPGTGNDLLSHGLPPVGSPGQPPAQCLPGPGPNPPDPGREPLRLLPGTGARNNPGDGPQSSPRNASPEPCNSTASTHPTKNRKPKTGHRQPSEKEARNYREISAKNTSRCNELLKNINQITCVKKIPRKSAKICFRSYFESGKKVGN